jgi:Tfp pilus assembly protein PilF
MKMVYPAEKMYALRILGKMNGDEESFKKAIEANKKLPNPHRCPHIWYGMWLYSQSRFQEAFDQFMSALDIRDRTTDYMVDPHSWDGYPFHLLSWCQYHLGDKDEAIAHAEMAIELEPSNEYYKKCLRKFKNEEASEVRDVDT